MCVTGSDLLLKQTAVWELSRLSVVCYKSFWKGQGLSVTASLQYSKNFAWITHVLIISRIMFLIVQSTEYNRIYVYPKLNNRPLKWNFQLRFGEVCTVDKIIKAHARWTPEYPCGKFFTSKLVTRMSLTSDTPDVLFAIVDRFSAPCASMSQFWHFI